MAKFQIRAGYGTPTIVSPKGGEIALTFRVMDALNLGMAAKIDDMLRDLPRGRGTANAEITVELTVDEACQIKSAADRAADCR